MVRVCIHAAGLLNQGNAGLIETSVRARRRAACQAPFNPLGLGDTGVPVWVYNASSATWIGGYCVDV